MRRTFLVVMAFAALLFGCGLESAGTAAVAAKQQAEQAKQGKEVIDNIKKNVDAAMTEAEQNRKKTEEAANN